MNNLFEILLNNNRSVVTKTLLPLKKKIRYTNTLSNKIVLLNNLMQLDNFKNLYINEHKNTKKQKKRRAVVLFRLLKLLLKNSSILFKTPIALHFNNVTKYKTLIVKKLKKKVFVKVIKEFNQVAYNGCRQSKIRRRKRLKNKFI